MSIVDVHCHLQADEFRETIDEVVAKAKDAKVTSFITNATEPSDWSDCLSLSKRYPEVFCALGIHPWYIGSHRLDSLLQIEDHVDEIVAIGECGLDAKYGPHTLTEQEPFFREQLKLANRLQLPLIVHCIAAFDLLKKCLREERVRVPLILHAFNSSKEMAKELENFSCYFSIGAMATYRDSKRRAAMIRYIYENERMLLESDAPDIPPREKKGEVNTPEKISYTLQALCEITKSSADEISSKTSKLAHSIFNLKHNSIDYKEGINF